VEACYLERWDQTLTLLCFKGEDVAQKHGSPIGKRGPASPFVGRSTAVHSDQMLFLLDHQGTPNLTRNCFFNVLGQELVPEEPD